MRKLPFLPFSYSQRVPYAEPLWLSESSSSPFFNESHRKLQKAVRTWVDEVWTPEAVAREADGKHLSKDFIKSACQLGILAMRMGPGKHIRDFNLMGSNVVEAKDFDYLSELVVTQELMRTGARGMSDGFLAGTVIGLPPVMNFANPALKERITNEVLNGDKTIALAISEPFAGSDVAGLKCEAVRSQDGKHFIINGVKKWITNGHFTDYFSVATRTANGLTMFFVERGPGVTTKPIKTSYSSGAGTAYIQFKDVKVPIENVLGTVDKGLQVILSNFNHERLVLSAGSARLARLIVEECFKWANQRIVFGKALITQPVIRQKLGAMVAQVEAVQAWLEQITYQMDRMSYAQQSEHLAGPIALLKYQCTRTETFISDNAAQIFGGRALTQSGMGIRIENYQRTFKFHSILGGSEEVLADFGIRQALRKYPLDSRL